MVRDFSLPDSSKSVVLNRQAMHSLPSEFDPQQQSSANPKVAVLGAGAWGSALAKLASANDNPVTVWSRRTGADLQESLQDAEVIVSAISMKGVPDIAATLKQLGIPERTIIVTATKGLDPNTRQTPSQIWKEALPNNPIAVLSGPNLSKEIQQGLPAATVVACENEIAAHTVQHLFASDSFRVYTNQDPIGTELGGTLKNIVAIAVGICEGLNLGTNAKSALVTRALTEMLRVGTHLGGQPETFFGLSGLGDLLATCSSSLSRNYRVGYGLAQGKSLAEILDELQETAEGVNTTNVLIDLANQEGIPVPVARQVYRLINGLITPTEAVAALMERDLKPESCELDLGA